MSLRREWMVSTVLLLAVVMLACGCTPEPAAKKAPSEPLSEDDKLLQAYLVEVVAAKKAANMQLRVEAVSSDEKIDALIVRNSQVMAREKELADLQTFLRDLEVPHIAQENDPVYLRMRDEIAAKEKSLAELREQLRQSYGKETKNLPLE